MAQVGPTTMPQPMQPSGPWSMDYADSQCVLSRTFGEKSEQIQLAIITQPATEYSEIALVFAKPVALPNSGKVVLALGDSAPLETSAFSSGISQTSNKRVVKITMTSRNFESILVSPILRIELANQPGRHFALRGTTDVISALNRCTDDLMIKWGGDPQAERQIVTPAKVSSDNPNWITLEDFPKIAVDQRHEGTTKIFWTIGLDGRAHDCRVVQSSGFSELDQASCAAILKRARYIPAKGAGDTPVISHRTRLVRWALPN